jgi:hypothetical protein
MGGGEIMIPKNWPWGIRRNLRRYIQMFWVVGEAELNKASPKTDYGVLRRYTSVPMGIQRKCRCRPGCRCDDGTYWGAGM